MAIQSPKSVWQLRPNGRIKYQAIKKQATEWHSIIAFRNLADIIGKYLKKGSQVYVEGKIRTRKWQAQDGTDRWTTEIIADWLEMLGSPNSGNSNNNWATEPAGNPPPTNPYNHVMTDSESRDFDDDIPF